MFTKLALVAILSWPAVAMAQPVATAMLPVPPLAPIGLPLPQIGLPRPQIGLPTVQPQPPSRPGRGGRPPHRRQRPHDAPVYLVPAYGWPYLYDLPVAATPGAPTAELPAAEPESLTGRVRLEVEPRAGQQVYVDGYYVGTAEDFDAGLELPEGLHSIEIRRRGFETLQLPVNIAAGRTITYRDTMKAADARPAAELSTPGAATAAAAAPLPPMTSYIIPGCYVGNVLPDRAGLPAGCDPAQMITLTP